MCFVLAEALTLSGSAGCWTPAYCVESILHVIIVNMVDCEVVQVRTAMGPGGLSGPLRIDLQSRGVMQEYSMAEARSAFHRMLAHHQQAGWGPGNPGSKAGSASPAPSGADFHTLLTPFRPGPQA